MATSLNGLAKVAHAQGDDVRATALYKESIVLRRELVDKHGIADCLRGLAGVAVAHGQLERAARLFGAADALYEAIGAPLPPSGRAIYDHNLAVMRAGLDEAAFAAARTAGRAMTLEQAISDVV